MAVKYLYLIDGRVSEAVASRAPSDSGTSPSGPFGKDVEVLGFEGVEASLFYVKSTHGAEGRTRICARPLPREYEPWSRELLEYFSKFDGEEPVFPMNRQKVWRMAREAWGDLHYPIEAYAVIQVDGEGNVLLDTDGRKLKRVISRHNRPFNLHAIRHLVATDLVVYYGFNGPNLSAFGGWTLSSAMGVSSAVNRYVQLDWRSYFPKLLKRRY